MSGVRLSRRQQRILACLTDTIVAPLPPLPPVEETDAVAAIGGWLARFPPLGRAGVRTALVALELAPRLTGGPPWHALAPAERLRLLDRIEHGTALGGTLVAALRALTGAGYYGDRGVAAAVGGQRRWVGR